MPGIITSFEEEMNLQEEKVNPQEEKVNLQLEKWNLQPGLSYIWKFQEFGQTSHKN